MTEQEHLYIITMEECAEIAQRISKAARFGMEEVQPGHTLTNRDRILGEYADLKGVLRMLGLDVWDEDAIAAKQQKVREFLKYSAECGTVSPS